MSVAVIRYDLDANYLLLVAKRLTNAKTGESRPFAFQSGRLANRPTAPNFF